MSTGDAPSGTGDQASGSQPTRSVAVSVAELPVEEALLLDEVCNAFETRWRSGDRPDIAAVLELPEAIRPAALKELVALEVFYRRKAGEPPTAVEYATRFPELDPDWLAGMVGVGGSVAGTLSQEPAGARRAVSAPARRIGTVIAGKYKLIELIGEGGMGSVYLARQSEPVKRDVALKLIKGGLDSKTVQARFDAERQALALMDHPSIARVYDGGTTATGQPFFVMELVRGVPLTQFCDEHRLPIPARLELFVQVCLAVQHAHQKGIIHRDLKPSNVLVSEVDGRPTPKVIDFGVAKATERLTDLSYAETGAIVGTPAYMSPEQADPSSTDIDTRTDVYALGVMLYELLTGSPPLDARDFARGAVLEMLRLVREVDPPRPSTKVGSSDSLPNIAANRNIEPAKLAKLLRGELDWVVMKALEKDRRRRYDTAVGLAHDLQRYLADEVVEARPPSRGYRLRKFVRRNKGQVVAAILIVLTLFAGIVGTSLALVQARRETNRADEQAEKATQAAERADREAKDARDAENRAKQSEAKSNESTRLAKWNERLAKDANHAIKLALAQRARELNDWGLIREVLDETHADYGQTFENRYVRAVWLRRTLPVRGFDRHTNFVTSAALSPDGKRAVSGSWDQTARVWDAETGNEVFTLTGHAHFVTAATFSPDGKRILTASWDRTARVWDAETGAERLILKGHAHYVLCAAFSRNGKRVVTGGYDNTARVWDAETGTEFLALTGHAGPVWGAAFSHDGTRIVTAGDSAARVWNADTGKELLALKGHAEPVTSAAFSPNGRRIVTGGHDRAARVWNAETGAELLALKGHTSWVTTVAFNPDGTRIVTGSHDQTARVWDPETGSEKLTLSGHTNAVVGAAFSCDGMRLVTASWDQTARVWSTEPTTERHVLPGHTNPIVCMAYSPDGTRIATGSGTDDRLGELKVWDIATGAERFTLKKFAEPLLSVAFSPDGTRIVTCGGSYDKFREVKVWDAGTGEEKGAFRIPDTDAARVAFSPDGKRVITKAEWKPIQKIWDAETGIEIVPKGPSSVWSVAFRPDSKRTLVFGETPGKPTGVKGWEAETGKVLFALNNLRKPVWACSLTPDGKQLLTAAGEDNKSREITVWDVETGQSLFALAGARENTVSAARFSPGGRLVVHNQNGSVEVWNPATGKQTLRFPAVQDRSLSLTFSPDSTQVATATRRYTASADAEEVKVWDTETGALIHTVAGAASPLSVVFSPDGRHLATSDGRVARVWELPRAKSAAPVPK